MIRIGAVWMAVAPLAMRAGMDAALARVITVFGAAQPRHAYLFANRRTNRMKVLLHDGIGIWLASRRLHLGRFGRRLLWNMKNGARIIFQPTLLPDGPAPVSAPGLERQARTRRHISPSTLPPGLAACTMLQCHSLEILPRCQDIFRVALRWIMLRAVVCL